ncbi:AcrR family transcriptional regulator [Litorivivens lipolytica]|uniref:AcrR family transcriptional regulator n=2 Tax=Litorivivens lipolytica TaxID=1524264 RepID=A0A7W4Z7K2_9GAMM|nr:TetR/AcrR family transcriptional regulator [Litorivivens lipolytica]MBB3048110.1 AcrR family transcriptional regulator [Litorivivens lipolytica]
MSDSTALTEARPPQQARGRERFERILEAAEAQLLARGASELSIPELASSLGYTRTSVYHFFPTPYAILNELTRRHLSAIEAQIEIMSQNTADKAWQDVIGEVSDLVSNYYNTHPVAGVLILGSAASTESHKALQLTVLSLGRYVDRLMRTVGVRLPSGELDAKSLTVELGTACLRLSWFLHGRITDAYRAECKRAIMAYLNQFITTENQP